MPIRYAEFEFTFWVDTMKTVAQVIEEAGPMKRIALKLGVSITAVCRWKMGHRKISTTHAVELGKLTGLRPIPQMSGSFLFEKKR